MANNVRVKFNRNGMYQLRSAPDVRRFLEAIGTDLRDTANETLDERVGYELSSRQGRKNPQGRWAVRVYTSSNHAKRSNAIHNTLLRVLKSP